MPQPGQRQQMERGSGAVVLLAGRPAQTGEQTQHLRAQGRLDPHRHLEHRMLEAQTVRDQQQAVAPVVLAKEAVVPAIPVGGITDDGVEQVIQMAGSWCLRPVLGKRRTRL